MKVKKVVPTKSGYIAETKHGALLVRFTKPNVGDTIKVKDSKVILNDKVVENNGGTLNIADHRSDMEIEPTDA